VLFGGIRGSGANYQVLDDLWIYDPARNAWTEIKSEAAPRYAGKFNPSVPADCQMLAYDEEHNVHVLVLQEWGKSSGMWAYRYRR
jgi:hypothetical protein